MGADELARYFPDRIVALFVATWNMQGQKVSGHRPDAGRDGVPSGFFPGARRVASRPSLRPSPLSTSSHGTDASLFRDAVHVRAVLG